jgi:hypothetical protein
MMIARLLGLQAKVEELKDVPTIAFDLSYGICYTRKQHPALSTWFGLMQVLNRLQKTLFFYHS